MMKRIFKYIPAIILAISSCSREILPEAPATPSTDDHYIVLTLSNAHPSATTKAGTIRGVNDLNENLVQRVDCFFYPNGATSSNAAFSALGRGAEVVEVEPDSLEYKVKIFFTEDDARAIFGSTTSGTCQAYVICNAPISYGSSTSVNSLKEQMLEHDFSAQTVMGNFVMHADAPFTVTLSTTGNVTSASGRVNVSRSAAKLQLYMQVPEKVWDDENQKYWYPMLDSPGADVRMRYLVKRGKIEGTYNPVSSDLVTTPYRPFHELSSGELIPGRTEYTYTHSPFYSYPTSWHDLSNDAPFFVFRIPWQMEGSASYEYRTYQLSPNLAGKILESNHFYRSYVRINSLGGVDEEHTVVISDCSYIIIPWLEDGTNAGQGLVPAEFMDYKYLVIGVPSVELNNEATATFDYVTSSPITSINVNKIIYYDNSQANPKRELTSGTAFNNAKSTITIDYGSEPGVFTVTHSLNNIYSQWEIFATVTNEEGITAEIHITQNPPIRLIRESDKWGSVFVNGFFGWVDNATFGATHSPYRDYQSTRNPFPTSYHCRSGWTQSGYSQQVEYNSGDIRAYGSIVGGAGNMNSTIDRNFFTLFINVSSFNSSNNTYRVGNQDIAYRIGDPRVPASSVYTGANAWTNTNVFYNYMTGETGNGNNVRPTGAAWESPGDIMIATQLAADQNIIAPRFLVSSAVNANGGLNFDNAVKRAATYQEAGYPAGRWRLPTEAEMAFIIARQNDGTIPNLYATGTPYWSGSGRLLTAQSGGAITFTNNDNSTHSERFVYDLWYWGDEPSTTNVYHPNGHIYDYDAAGNSTPRTL